MGANLAVLTCLQNSRRPMTSEEIAERCAISHAMARGACTSLKQMGKIRSIGNGRLPYQWEYCGNSRVRVRDETVVVYETLRLAYRPLLSSEIARESGISIQKAASVCRILKDKGIVRKVVRDSASSAQWELI